MHLQYHALLRSMCLQMRALRVSTGAARALPCPLSRSRAPLQRAGFRGAVLRAAAQEQAADDVVAQVCGRAYFSRMHGWWLDGLACRLCSTACGA